MLHPTPRTPSVPAQKLPIITSPNTEETSSEPQWKTALRQSKVQKSFEAKKKEEQEALKRAAVPIWKRHIMEVKEKKAERRLSVNNSNSPNITNSTSPSSSAESSVVSSPAPSPAPLSLASSSSSPSPSPSPSDSTFSSSSSSSASSTLSPSWTDSLSARDKFKPIHTRLASDTGSARFNTLERGNISALGMRNFAQEAPLVPKALQLTTPAEPVFTPAKKATVKKNVSFFEEEEEIPYIEYEAEIEEEVELATTASVANEEEDEEEILSTLRVAALARPESSSMQLNVGGNVVYVNEETAEDMTNLEDDLAAMIW